MGEGCDVGEALADGDGDGGGVVGGLDDGVGVALGLEGVPVGCGGGEYGGGAGWCWSPEPEAGCVGGCAA